MIAMRGCDLSQLQNITKHISHFDLKKDLQP